MPTRYIRKDDKLHYAMVIKSKYRLPVTNNVALMQPQYIILSEKKGLLEVMYYSLYVNMQQPDFDTPVVQRQVLIPLSHIVKEGDDVAE